MSWERFRGSAFHRQENREDKQERGEHARVSCLAFPPCPPLHSLHSTMLSLSMNLGPSLAGMLLTRGHLLNSAVPCPWSLLSHAQTAWILQVHCGLSLDCRLRTHSPSALFGLWPSPPSCQGAELKCSMAAHLLCSPGPGLGSGERHTYRKILKIIIITTNLWLLLVTKASIFHLFSHSIFIVTSK